MDMRPAAFVAAAAVIAGAAGFGAYLAVRDNAVSDTDAAPDAQVAMATATGVAMPVDATEQVVEPPPVEPAPAEPEPGAAAAGAPPAPRVAERRAAPPPAPSPPPAPAPEPEPEPERGPAPAPEVEPAGETGTSASDASESEPANDVEAPAPPDEATPAEARDSVDDLPRIDGWRRVERPAEPTASDGPDAAGTTDVDPEPVAVDADGWPVVRTAETAAGSVAGAAAGFDPSGAPVFPGWDVAEEVVIEADSVIGLQIDTHVSSDSAEMEDDVQARVTRDVIEQDRVVIPAGAVVMGSVVLVEQAGQFRGTARLGVRFHTIVFGDGVETPIMTETVYREGESQGKQNAAKVGGGAIAGAILGAIFGGGRGAAIGGAAGASAGTAAAAGGDSEPATLVAGSMVTVRLSRPATITVDP